MKKNYFLLTAIVLFASVQMMFAQNGSDRGVDQVFVVSGGAFSDPDDFVTVASYVQDEGTTTVFDTIFTQSVQSAVVFDILYVAAQDSIVAYDVATYSRVAAIAATGVNQLFATDDLLIASFWYPDTADFVKIYNRHDLTQLAAISEVSDEAAGIAVIDNKAYVAVPGGWASTVGKMAVIDLTDYSFVQEVDLGTDGAGIKNVFAYRDQGSNRLLTVNPTPWNGTTGVVMKIDPVDMSVETTAVLNVVLGKGIGVFFDDAQYLYALINGGIGSISLDDFQVADTTIVSPPAMSIAGAACDGSQFYVTTTDYATVGDGAVYNLAGDSVTSFEAGISAEAIAIHYVAEAVNEIFAEGSFSVYPNPTNNNATVLNSNGVALDKVVVTDLTGRVVMLKQLNGEKSSVQLNLSGVNSGLYLVSLYGDGKVFTAKVVKQ